MGRKLLLDDADHDRVSAAVALLDRGYGKPRQAVALGEDPQNAFKRHTAIEIRVVDPKDRRAEHASRQ